MDRRGARSGRRPPIRGHTLLISNHVSWLDILVLGGATGCAFVSKDELGHPLVHWLADQNRDRLCPPQSPSKARSDQAAAIARSLEGDKPVALFPEGTTGPGNPPAALSSNLARSRQLRRKRRLDPASRAGLWPCGRRNRLVARAWKGQCAAPARPTGLAAGDRSLLGALDRAGDRKQLAARRSRRDRSKAWLNVGRPLAYRRGGDDSQDLQNQKLRLPDERL